MKVKNVKVARRLQFISFGVVVLAICACMLPLAHGQASPDKYLVPLREWQNAEGKKVSAPVVRLKGSVVVFLIDGREVNYPVELLSQDDQKFLQQLPVRNKAQAQKSVTFLCIRANFADRQIFPQEHVAWNLKLDALFKFAEPYYRVQSYGQIAKMPHQTTEVFLIDESWTAYKGKEGELADAMRTLARAQGWKIEDFDHVVLSFPSIDGNYGALGTPGTIWMPGDNPWPPGFAHELGHAFAVGHACTWEGGEAAWPGIHDEGSDANFTMGSGAVGAAWNLPMKFKVGWVPEDKIIQATPGAQVVHRIYQFDTPKLTNFGDVGLRVGDFWISYAPSQTHWLKDGVPPSVAQQGVFIHTLNGEITRLVDATPNSRKNPDRSQSRLDPFHDTKDAALTIGNSLILDQSASHPGYEVRIKPLRIGKTRNYYWIDVEVDYRIHQTPSMFAAEAFQGKPGNLTPSLSGSGWTSRWESNGSAASATVIEQGLQYEGLQTSGGALQLVASKDEKDTLVLSRGLQRSVGAASTSIWISCLFQARNQQVGDILLQLGDNPELSFGKPWSSNFGIYTSHSQVAVEDNQTYLLVAKLDIDSIQSTARLWVDPKLGPTPPAASAVVMHQAAFRPADTLKVKLQGYGRGSYVVDEIRVGPSFQAVTPRIDN